jgi:hypothetical protein
MAPSTNGHNGVHHEADEMIDNLYAWVAPMTPPQTCPEAALSLTLKGTIQGIEAMLTIRGQSPEEFKRHLASVKGLLDQPQPPAPAASQGEGWCRKHGLQMKQTHKDGRSWFSHYDEAAGRWCKGK